MKKRIFALCLALSMTFGMVMPVSAADTSVAAVQESVQTEAVSEQSSGANGVNPANEAQTDESTETKDAASQSSSADENSSKPETAQTETEKADSYDVSDKVQGQTSQEAKQASSVATERTAGTNSVTSLDDPSENVAKTTFTASDFETGKQIKDASIKVTDAKGISTILPASDGTFSLQKDTIYQVTASADGYFSWTESYTEKEAGNQDISLQKDNGNLAQITLEARDQNTDQAISNPTYSVNQYLHDNRTPVKAFRDGVYYLEKGAKYSIRTSADGYIEPQATEITVTRDDTVTILMTAEVSEQEASSQAVQNVIAMINALPSNPKESDRPAIIAAQRALIALESDEESRVTNRARLNVIYSKLGPKVPSQGDGDYYFTDIQPQKGTQTRGAYQVESIKTTSHGEGMFRVIYAVLHVKNGKMTADIVLSGRGYRYLRLGTATDAFNAEEAAGGYSQVNQADGVITGKAVIYESNGTQTRGYEFENIPVETLDSPILVAANSNSHDAEMAKHSIEDRRTAQGDGTNSESSIWFQRALIFSSSNLVAPKKDNASGSSTSGQGGKSGSGSAATAGDDKYIRVDEQQRAADERERQLNNSGANADKASQNVGKSSGSNTGVSGNLHYVFQWGSSTAMGHDNILCEGISVRGTQVYATIRFVRKASVGGVPQFSAVRSLGQTVYGNNTFTIPVNVNANTAIEALTSAMSQDHWVHYSIYVGLDQTTTEQLKEAGVQNIGGNGGAIQSTVTANTRTMDKTAPEITGLKAKKNANEEQVTYSPYVRIFSYENDIYLIEVDASAGTVREGIDGDTLEKNMEEASDKEASDADNQADAKDADKEDAGKKNVDSDKSDANSTGGKKDTNASSIDAIRAKYRNRDLSKPYRNEIIKYLVVPEDAEIPAGLDKDVVIIHQPVKSAYVASSNVLDALADLGAERDVTTLGIKAKELTSGTCKAADAYKARMKKKYDGDDKITYAGTYDDMKLRQIIKSKTDLAIVPSEILPQDEKTLNEDFAAFTKTSERASLLGFGLFVDRSGDEENDLAKAEWYRAYGIIFGVPDAGEKLYQNVLKNATASEKKEAEKAAEDALERAASVRAAEISEGRK